jgi:choline dehydrogenase-like flavoprotein
MPEDERVVVIGSGPAGAMAARELVRRRLPVTMLESGTTRPTGLLVRAGGRNLYRRTPPVAGRSEPFVISGHADTLWTTHLEPGGLSNQWTGAVPRFSPADFCDGTRLDKRYEWPLTYEHLAPYYEDAERVLRVVAARANFPTLPAGYAKEVRQLPKEWREVSEVARRRGQGLTVLPLAEGPPWLLARRGTAFNSYTNIVERLLSSDCFEIRTGAHALRLEWSGRQRRIESVVYRDLLAGSEKRIWAAAVVVACGALHSTKLLFDSACDDFPDGLGNTDGNLGRYLHDHPKEWWVVELERPIRRLSPAAYLTRQPYEQSPPLLATSWTIGHANVREKLMSFTGLPTRTLGVQVFGSMCPTVDRCVRPDSTRRDEFGLPQLDVDITFTSAELDNVVRSRQLLVDLLTEAKYPCTIQSIVPQLVPGSAVHYGGTARMHRSREYGVIDEWNRPFDIPNLVIADASCFTTNTEKNPTLTAMALATRASRRLAVDLRGE